MLTPSLAPLPPVLALTFLSLCLGSLVSQLPHLTVSSCLHPEAVTDGQSDKPLPGWLQTPSSPDPLSSLAPLRLTSESEVWSLLSQR